MFDRVTLSDDLIDCRGQVLARRGFVISAQSIAEAAQRAPRLPRRPVSETFVAGDLLAPLDSGPYRHLLQGPGVRAGVEEALLAIRFPDALWDELALARQSSASLYEHALVTAVVAVRMLLAAVGAARGVPDLAAAALAHDLGMRHLPARLLRNRDRLSREESRDVAAHPLLGAYHLALLLGAHPAVAAAQSHHWRCGQGYPGLASPPPRSILVVGVASAFAALTRPRPYRSEAYDPRGAADVLIEDVAEGHADANTVKLLVHALRGGCGDVRALRFGHAREGHGPTVNRHTRVSAPERSAV